MLTEAITRLVRVLRTVRRKRPDGKVISYKRAFYVKKASPNDRYALEPNERSKVAQAKETEPQSVEAELEPQSLEQPIVSSVDFTRIEVEPMEMPWGIGDSHDSVDPVPAEIRRRFSPENRATRNTNPVNHNIPINYVQPGEDLLWGGTDAELLNRLRTGFITQIKASNTSNTHFLCKIESTDGNVERAYIKFDGLADQDVYKLYGDMYDLGQMDGSLARRAGVAYEIAKAVGLDDVVPPTVYRFNEHNGLDPVLSLTVTDRLSELFGGCSSDAIRDLLGDHAYIQLWADPTGCAADQAWFKDLNNEPDKINYFYSNCGGPRIASALLRGAVFDFITWNGSRTFSDILFYESERHPVGLSRNEIIMPSPIAVGAAYLDYGSKYSEGCPPNVQYMPLLWSDLVMTAALRGYEGEALIYEQIAVECARRLKGDRVTDLVRCLGDHGIDHLGIAALLVRIAFLRYGSRVCMRDPLVVARYFSSILTGDQFDPGFDINIQEMEESINKVISSARTTDFSFRDAMSGGDAE